ncbi:MAG: preprotein translocase subunit SecA [Candidatus Omnitrophica bacterium]|nr:preprotein translocase subunit SecA [Candidatus Omnitrophota bacterium]
MIMGLFRSIFGTQDERRIRKTRPIIEEINRLEDGISKLRDDEIKARALELSAAMKAGMKSIEAEEKAVREAIAVSSSQQERNKHKKALRKLKNEVIDEKLSEVFALVREASRRTIGLRHFDVQLIGGMVLHGGNITEMTTGEGKTLVATLAASLNALAGERVHVVTVNDYLAKRDSDWMGPIYRFLGLSVGVIQHDMRPEIRKVQYASDIVYGTNNEFGFDYLRDNMVVDPYDMVQGHLGYAVVDEVDSILIDEARTPLIISGPVDETNESYNEMRPIVEEIVKQQKRLVRDYMAKLRPILDTGKDEAGNLLYLVHKADPKNREFLDLILKDLKAKGLLDRAQSNLDSKMMEKEKDDILQELFYVFDEKSRDTTFSAKGLQLMKDKFSLEFMLEDLEAKLAELSEEEIPEDEKIKKRNDLTVAYAAQQRNVESIKQLLKAFILFERDVDYVINENKIVIVDSFTGRMMPGRRFSDGLHEAIEAKERVEVQRESQTLATITLQNYFRMYDKLSGMTGTAKTEEMEFESIYLLSVVQIPTNKGLRRENFPDRIYKTEEEKFNAIGDDVAGCNAKGRPVLVGTISIEKSERLSRLLSKKGVKHNVLNAKHHAREASIVAQAGRFGAVTIATNMAGRGTDILLGGSPEALAHDEVEKLAIEDPIERAKVFEKYLAEFKDNNQAEHDKVVNVGGLHVTGTERHESRRIDNQLRGRSGRQGDPGSSRFYLSLEDDLMRIFGSDRIKAIMNHLGMEEGEVIENPLVTRAVATAQKRVEGQNFEIRKHLLKYDDIMNRQREIIYTRRRMILTSEDLREEFLECFSVSAESLLLKWDEDPDTATLIKNIMYKYVMSVKEDEIEKLYAKDILALLTQKAGDLYSMREKLIGKDRLRDIEKMIMLSVIDSNWKEYLREIDDLREGISWRAYAQKDPFVEFQHEAFGMFQELMSKIDEQVAERLMKISLMEEQFKKRMMGQDRTVYEHKEFSALSAPGAPRDEDGGETGGGRPGRPSGMPHGEAPVTIKRDAPKVGRNDECPCGSGKKYKKCCGV